jgi:hypothetical protein
MIEAWYTAGVPTQNLFKASIPPTVEDVDKQAFARIFGERAQNLEERIIPIAEPEFIITPLLQVPPASRGEPCRAPTRFPLLAGGTLRRGSLLSLIFANYGCAIGIILLQQILDVYDWNLALQRSESLRYCATRLGIAP